MKSTSIVHPDFVHCTVLDSILDWCQNLPEVGPVVVSLDFSCQHSETRQDQVVLIFCFKFRAKTHFGNWSISHTLWILGSSAGGLTRFPHFTSPLLFLLAASKSKRTSMHNEESVFQLACVGKYSIKISCCDFLHSYI